MYHASVGSSLQSPRNFLGRCTSPRSVTREKKVENLFTSFVPWTDRICVERKLTVCCRPPGIRCSSNKLLRANGDGVVIVADCESPLDKLSHCHATGGVTLPLSRVTIALEIRKRAAARKMFRMLGRTRSHVKYSRIELVIQDHRYPAEE